MSKLQDLVKENKELFWDVKDISKLDEITIEERFLQYGNWKNIKQIDKVLGKEKLTENYIKIRSKKRTNLNKKTINFFNLYFNV